MRVLVVYAQPRAESLCAAAMDRAVAGLNRGGHQVELRDLYAVGFDPTGPSGENAEDERLLAWAEALVFVYPTWWGGQPAILKGWLDRVLVSGGFGPSPDSAVAGQSLRHIRRIVVVTTHGSSKWVNSLQGEPGKRVLLRGVRALAHRRARGRWVAAYGVDRSSDADRLDFLERVEHRLARL